MKKSSFIIILIILLTQSCAATIRSRQALYHADTLFDNRKYNEAIKSYSEVTTRYPKSYAAEEAQYLIAYTLVYYDNPDADYARALIEFNRFIRLYPSDNKIREARNWVNVLHMLNHTINENKTLQSSCSGDNSSKELKIIVTCPQ
ncbi:MAG: outer membrane protein assembly factor BamD [Deltaproteobacteria bacterium]|nr:outer membrane protein assembly factor BamD [Deltaproteobacteria bacterium]